jgi:undecaprenyl diphosphate synthase
MVQQPGFSPDDLNEQNFSRYLATPEDVDLLIRTGGEKRVSNFLIWQMAYAELYVTDVLWPDFDENVYLDALNWYAERERRFGYTGDQIKNLTVNKG